MAPRLLFDRLIEQHHNLFIPYQAVGKEKSGRKAKRGLERSTLQLHKVAAPFREGLTHLGSYDPAANAALRPEVPLIHSLIAHCLNPPSHVGKNTHAIHP